MKTRLVCSLLAAVAQLSSLSASIIYWEDNDVGSPLEFLHEKWGSNDNDFKESFSKTWNILATGFQPGVNTIDGIELTFAFADDKPGNFEGAEIANGGDIEEYVDIFLEKSGTTSQFLNKPVQIYDDLEVDGRHPYDTYQFFSLTLDQTTHSAVFSELALTGKLKYRIQLAPKAADTGNTGYYLEDTYFKVAKIRAYQSIPDEPSNVPDAGSTLLGLGCSLCALLGIKRKFALGPNA